ncbi:MAG TPA: hypothetical protein G4N92_02835 [Anaerolineae bacterium]|nr:hypothetical protein [Anaerolineae bacterium]
MEEIIIKVNGKEISLTEFPKRIITKTIIAMLQSLKNIDELRKIEILIKS